MFYIYYFEEPILLVTLGEKVKRFTTMGTRIDYIQEGFQSHLDFKNYTTLNYTLYYITQHYVQIGHDAKRKGSLIENAAMS